MTGKVRERYEKDQEFRDLVDAIRKLTDGSIRGSLNTLQAAFYLSLQATDSTVARILHNLIHQLDMTVGELRGLDE